MQPALRLANVTKRYGNQTVLDRVSFEVPPGCVFALLGENVPARPRRSACCWGWSNPTPALPKFWAATRADASWKFCVTWAMCPSGRPCTTG